ncbi:ferritin-like domain-containing protein [Chloroflexota bacterium]
MDKVIISLKFMQNMERFATKVYKKQIRAFIGHEIADRLKVAANNEQEHVDILTKRIEELKGTQPKMGIFFHIAGAIFGIKTTLLGKVLLLKTDIWIEKRAVQDYGKFLQKIDFDEATITIINNIIQDEKRHIETWEDSIKITKG